MINSGSIGRPSVLITDLDNTLWDWFRAWYASFSVMLERVSELSGVPVAVLEPEMRAVHQERRTSEYSFLLNEVPSLAKAAGGADPLTVFDDAVHALNRARRLETKLYDGVDSTLRLLQASGVRIFGYTESLAYWTQWRIQHTDLDGVIEVLYSSPDHEIPTGTSLESIRRRPMDTYELSSTTHRHLPVGSSKPNPTVLRSILADAGVSPSEAVYVGDSLMKDIAMAQDVGVLDVHAKYGVVTGHPEYDLLRRVTHWTDEDVEREREIAAGVEVMPSVVANEFREILDVFGIEGGNA